MSRTAQLFPCPIAGCCDGMLTAEGLRILSAPAGEDPLAAFIRRMCYDGEEARTVPFERTAAIRRGRW